MAAVPGTSAYGTKPSQLAPAVPKPQAQDSLDDIFADVSAGSAQMNAGTQQVAPQPGPAAPQGDSLDSLLADVPAAGQPAPEAAEDESIVDKALHYGKEGLETAGQALDYAGGFMRTGLASSAGMLAGKGMIVTEKDLANALKGKAPNSAEYLARLGIPELGSVDLPLIGKTTGRGAVGFAADIASDPLIAIGKLAKQVPYIRKLINAPGVASEALGEAVYKSAVSKIDAKIAAKNGLEQAAPVAEALLSNGAPVGSTAKLAKKIEDISQTMGKLRQGLYDRAAAAGIKAELTSMPKAEKLLAEMRKDPGLAPAAEELAQLVERYKQAGTASLSDLSQWKTNLYDALPASSFGSFGKLKGKAQQFKAALAEDFKDLIVKTGNKGEKGLGDSISAINDKWGPLIEAKNPLARAAAKTGPGLVGSQIDNALLSLTGIPKYAIKKGLDLATTTTGRTAVGKALMKAGQSGVAQRGFVNVTRPSAEEPVEE